VTRSWKNSFVARWYNFFTDEILSGADQRDVAFLVVGDPFGYVI
jgi:precorrin-2 methylase